MAELVAKAKLKDELIFQDGDTNDIVKVVLSTVKGASQQTEGFSRQFTPSKEGLKSLFDWVKKNIKYKEDPDGVQWIQTPSRLYHTKQGDCKSFTVFIVSVFENLGLEYTVRFASYSKDKIITHVYPVAILDGKEIIVDAVWGKFDSEKKYTFKKDYTMSEIYRLSGVGCPDDKVGNIIDNTKNMFNLGLDASKQLVKSYQDKINQWIRDKTINKVAFMTLHYFYPYPVKADSPTFHKIRKATIIYNWLVKHSPASETVTNNIIRMAIKDKTGYFPEQIFKEILPFDATNSSNNTNVPENQTTRGGATNVTTGRRGIGMAPVVAAALITSVAGLVSTAGAVAITYINANSGADQSHADREIDQAQLEADTQAAQQALQTMANNQTDTANTGTETSNNNTVMYALLAVGAYYVLTD